MSARGRLMTVACMALCLASCVTTSTLTLDTDKAIIVAQDGYHVASVAARAVLANPATSPAVKAAIHAADDRAVVALHTAFRARTSAAVSLAVAAITDLQFLTGSK